MDHQLPEMPDFTELFDLAQGLEAPVRGVVLNFIGTVENLPYLFKAVTSDEMPEFFDGIRPILHRFIDASIVPAPDAGELFKLLGEFAQYLQSWTLTARLSANADWLRQMQESAADDSKDPVSIEDLRTRLAG